ncbi:MAG: hypothetical protein R6U68_02895, partial [Desulfobacteraceae bacterium]
MAKPKSIDLNDDFISGGEKEHQENGDNTEKSKKKKKAGEKKDKKVRVNFMLYESTRKKLFHHKAETGRTVSSI